MTGDTTWLEVGSPSIPQGDVAISSLYPIYSSRSRCQHNATKFPKHVPSLNLGVKVPRFPENLQNTHQIVRIKPEPFTMLVFVYHQDSIPVRRAL